VADGELCRVGFEGGKAVAEVRGGAVEGCGRGHAPRRRRSGGLSRLSVQDVQSGVAEEAELGGEVLGDEETADDSYFAGLG
jgi:hypothetical protein